MAAPTELNQRRPTVDAAKALPEHCTPSSDLWLAMETASDSTPVSTVCLPVVPSSPRPIGKRLSLPELVDRFEAVVADVRLEAVGGEVGHERGGGRVEADNIEHAGVGGVGDAEAVGHHADHDELGVDASLLPVPAQGLSRVDFA
jgi:hypothetical protein